LCAPVKFEESYSTPRVSGSSAARLAHSSAFSFPETALCAGHHRISIVMSGLALHFGRWASQAVLDFFSATDVGRRVPAEEDLEIEASGWEQRAQRGRGEERGAEAEELDAGGGGGGVWAATAVPVHAFFHGVRRRGGAGDESRFPLFFPLSSPWVFPCGYDFICFVPHFLGTGLGGGQRGACNVPPPRGQQTGGMDNWRAAIVYVDRLHASMNKLKKRQFSPFGITRDE